MVKPLRSGVGQESARFVSAAWVYHMQVKKDDSELVFLGRDSSEEEDSAVIMSRYDWVDENFSKSNVTFYMEDGAPRLIAVHPGGDGVIIAFSNRCRVYEWEEVEVKDPPFVSKLDYSNMKLVPAVWLLGELENLKFQSSLAFSADGSIVGSGGEDGRIRVFEWITNDVILDVSQTHERIKDMDFSLDTVFLATTSDKGPCRIWDTTGSSGLVMILLHDTGETFEFCRFSRDERKPFLFVTATKEQETVVGVWDLASWKRLGNKKVQDEPITSMAISHDGKRLAFGSQTGEIMILEIQNMEVVQRIRFAHIQSVVCLQFSPKDRSMLSLSIDHSVCVSKLDYAEDWKEWRVWLLISGIVIFSLICLIVLARGFSHSSDSIHHDVSSMEHLEYNDWLDYQTNH